jgi:hypothetical protein
MKFIVGFLSILSVGVYACGGGSNDSAEITFDQSDFQNKVIRFQSKKFDKMTKDFTIDDDDGGLRLAAVTASLRKADGKALKNPQNVRIVGGLLDQAVSDFENLRKGAIQSASLSERQKKQEAEMKARGQEFVRPTGFGRGSLMYMKSAETVAESRAELLRLKDKIKSEGLEAQSLDQIAIALAKIYREPGLGTIMSYQGSDQSSGVFQKFDKPRKLSDIFTHDAIGKMLGVTPDFKMEATTRDGCGGTSVTVTPAPSRADQGTAGNIANGTRD